MRTFVKSKRVLAFRFSRHFPASAAPKSIENICEAIGGVQAQVLSAAELMFRARLPNVTREEIHAALWQKRSLVKTYALRSTLHLLTINDLPVFIAAMKSNRLAWMRNTLKHFDISAKEARAMSDAVVTHLKDGPKTQPELVKKILPGVSRNMKTWMDHSWSVFRQALVEGRICYGPNQGAKTTLALVDDWLDDFKEMNESAAQEILFQRFLKAYGPASLQDFSRWTGLTMKEARAIHKRTKLSMLEVEFDGREGLLLEEDFEPLTKTTFEKGVVRLLPSFDPYLLAHVDKSQYLNMDFYKRIYRPSAWLTPAILLDGRVIGCWPYKRKGKRLEVAIEPFEKLSKTALKKIECGISSHAQFLGLEKDVVRPER